MTAPGTDTADAISGGLRAALLRESVALVDAGIATPADVDTVVRTTIGRRLSVAGPFAIWEQIGWDLVQVIAGELLQEISNAEVAPSSLGAMLSGAEDDGGPDRLADGADMADTIGEVAVIGAGLMGHGIALELAAAGRSVRLHDLSPTLLADAMARVYVGLQALAGTGRISDADANAAAVRISTTTTLADCVGDVDLVIEAASENRELKRQIFEQLDASAPAHAILASNTSTFLPSAYAASTTRPAQVLLIRAYNSRPKDQTVNEQFAKYRRLNERGEPVLLKEARRSHARAPRIRLWEHA